MKCFVSESDDQGAVGGTDRKNGFIILPLLLFLMACSGTVLCYGRSVYQEAEAVREFLCRKQLETIAQSFMLISLQQEKETVISDAVYNLPLLQPGNNEVRIVVSVNRVKDFGLRFLKVEVADSNSNEFSLRQCVMFFPAPLIQLLENPVTDLSGSAGKEETGEKKNTITSKSGGAVFPQFSIGEIAEWASTGFPSPLEMQRDGLSGWIYLSRKEISLPKGLKVNGDGILCFGEDVTIGDNSVFTGRIIILADCNLHIGNQVRLEKSLLLCRGKVTIGTDSFINGAVMAKQGVVTGENVTIIGDKEVLEPFNSIISY